MILNNCCQLYYLFSCIFHSCVCMLPLPLFLVCLTVCGFPSVASLRTYMLFLFFPLTGPPSWVLYLKLLTLHFLSALRFLMLVFNGIHTINVNVFAQKASNK